MLLRVVALIYVLNLIALCSGASTWKVVEKNYAAIAMSVSFQEQQSGWIAGSSKETAPFLLHTKDGGATLDVSPVDANEGVLMSISMADAEHGIAGGLAAVGKLPCGFQTNDGKNWVKIHDGLDILCAVQDCSAPASNVFVMIGEFSHLGHLAADGIQVSTDGGAAWTIHNWNQQISARYGKFIDSEVGYVTGGDWPDNNSSRLMLPVQLSHHVRHDGKSFKINKQSSPQVDGYRGVISSTVDGGKTWKTLVNFTKEGVYFNEISCTDFLNCWVVAEGVNKTTGTTAAYIYATIDGFKTIQQQLYFEHGSFIAINMKTPTFGWAAGADLREEGLVLFKGTFYQTLDGKTWKMFQQVPNFYPMDVSTVDADYAYAAGLNDDTLAELVQFAPH